MANNGYLFDGVCISQFDAITQKCKSSFPSYTYIAITIYPTSSFGYCLISQSSVYNAPPNNNIHPNCVIDGPLPPSTIPTVADGITLGWQAGGALILVGCILFLKKALK
jgi:hypothetical protein